MPTLRGEAHQMFGLSQSSLTAPDLPSLNATAIFETCGTKSALSLGAPSPTQPFGEKSGVRILCDEKQGIGYMDAVRFSDEMLLIVHNRELRSQIVSMASVEDWISIHFRISGASTHQFGPYGELNRRSPSCLMVMYPPGVKNCEWFDETGVLSSANLLLKPSFFLETLGIDPSRLPKPLRDRVEGRADDFFFHQFRFTASMHQAISDLINVPYMGTMRYVHAEARAMELACMVGHAIENEINKPEAMVQLRPNEQKRLHDVKSFLVESIANPPTIVELAKFAGINRTKLQYGFRQLFGVTIFDFTQRARMEMALRLLDDRNLTIAQVAHRTGYQHPGNFTAAFKRHYGFLPRDERQTLRS
jgi:AraC family transcriptional regulator, transcriptional activator of the genes for pyochelin and ferripyochelin receptors